MKIQDFIYFGLPSSDFRLKKSPVISLFSPEFLKLHMSLAFL
jgi:hypothetical protein